jgi:iron complex transport system substrate-binding protein
MNNSKFFILIASFTLLPFHLAAYDRVVSLKPNVTEILFALGVGSKVVGDTIYCHNPPEAETRPKVGGYSNPVLETILGLRPDLVVMIPDSTSPKIEEAIRRAGITTLVLKSEGLDDIYQSIQTVADTMQVSPAGQKLVAEMKAQIQQIRTAIPTGPKKKVVVVIQRRPLIVAGSRNFLNDLVVLSGGINIAGSSSLPYPRLSMDTVITEAPDVILDLDPTPPEGLWNIYTTLPAVKNHAIYQLAPDLFIPGPRVPKTLETLVEKIYSMKHP